MVVAGGSSGLFGLSRTALPEQTNTSPLKMPPPLPPAVFIITDEESPKVTVEL